MTLRLVTLLLLSPLSLFVTMAHASTITMPNVFSNGTPADANEVNANFDVLVTESNAQDLRILTLELLGPGITGVTAGFGLTGGGTSGSVSVAVDTTTIQQRVSGTCSPGDAIREIAADGTVTCEPTGTGDITDVIAGTGLSGGGASGAVTLDVSGIGSLEITDGSITDDDVGTLAHGLLSGLSNDDHPQYINAAGDTMTGSLSLGGNALNSVGSLNVSGTSTLLGNVYVNSATNWLSYPTGTYGSIQINGEGKANWEGFSINGRFALISGSANSYGTYNDVDNTWVTLFQKNDSYRIYQPNSSGSIALTVDDTGYVGIGTTSPLYALDVVGGGRFQSNLDVDGSIRSLGLSVIDANAGWHRTHGNTGWRNVTHGGGWYMTDANWIRAYNGKGVLAENIIQSNNAVLAPIFYDSIDTNYFLDPASTSHLNDLRLFGSGLYMGFGTARLQGSGAGMGINLSYSNVDFTLRGLGGGNTYLLYVENTAGTNHFHVTDTGTVYARTLTKTAGSFEIDHPDTAKKGDGWKLRHSFVESPTRGDNLYRFRASTVDGTADIPLPDYFRHLNEDVQVWVSPVRHFGNAYGEVDNELGTVHIASNSDGEYNVLVVATRMDADAVAFWDEKGVEYQQAAREAAPGAAPVH